MIRQPLNSSGIQIRFESIRFDNMSKEKKLEQHETGQYYIDDALNLIGMSDYLIKMSKYN